ncbi:hypothetical protein [Bartonella rattimassiliensis]
MDFKTEKYLGFSEESTKDFMDHALTLA